MDTDQHVDLQRPQTVLVVGATGRLGSRVAHHLLQLPHTDVRLLVRPHALNDAVKARRIAALTQQGAQVIEGDLQHPGSLIQATQQTDVVISTVQGGPDVVLDGQLALLDAAQTNGVRRMLPSDFTLDVFNTPPGDLPTYDLQRQADQAIQTSGLEHVHVLTGLFMDALLTLTPLIDLEAHTMRVWGDGTERFDVIGLDDAAQYAARAAVDRTLPSGKFSVASQTLSLNEMTTGVQQITGRPLHQERLGSLTDLQRHIAQRFAATANPWETLFERFYRTMLDGSGTLSHLQNNRYPEVEPESFQQFLTRTITGRGATS